MSITPTIMKIFAKLASIFFPLRRITDIYVNPMFFSKHLLRKKIEHFPT